MTNEQHNNTLGYAFFFYGAFQFLITLIVASFILFASTMGRPGRPAPPAEFFGLIVGFALIAQLLFAVPSFIAAYGIFKRKTWARYAGVAAAMLSVANVPVGTAVGVYAFWFLLGDSWRSVYGAGADRFGNSPAALNAFDVSKWTGYRVDERGEITFQPVERPDWR
ncbi:hypothetical protein BH10ACI2_BH10ACI2_06770 [soil metagenome]